MSQWFDEITLELVAKDAGVTVQTVIRRFGGKEGLITRAGQVLSEQIKEQRTAPPGDLAGMVTRLLADYEQTGDAVLRLLALELRHPVLKPFLDFGRREHRDWTAGVFASRLHRLKPAARDAALDALVVATDVYTWKLLRRDRANSVAATQTILVRLIQAILTEFSPTN